MQFKSNVDFVIKLC